MQPYDDVRSGMIFLFHNIAKKFDSRQIKSRLFLLLINKFYFKLVKLDLTRNLLVTVTDPPFLTINLVAFSSL
jgi:hypothetical protein